jgi:hypothetical protein
LVIKVNKEPIEAKTQDDLESIYSEWREQNGKPKYFFMRDKQALSLFQFLMLHILSVCLLR